MAVEEKLIMDYSEPMGGVGWQISQLYAALLVLQVTTWLICGIDSINTYHPESTTTLARCGTFNGSSPLPSISSIVDGSNPQKYIIRASTVFQVLPLIVAALLYHQMFNIRRRAVPQWLSQSLFSVLLTVGVVCWVMKPVGVGLAMLVGASEDFGVHMEGAYLAIVGDFLGEPIRTLLFYVTRGDTWSDTDLKSFRGKLVCDGINLLAIYIMFVSVVASSICSAQGYTFFCLSEYTWVVGSTLHLSTIIWDMEGHEFNVSVTRPHYIAPLSDTSDSEVEVLFKK